jgi:hypothetical protein
MGHEFGWLFSENRHNSKVLKEMWLTCGPKKVKTNPHRFARENHRMANNFNLPDFHFWNHFSRMKLSWRCGGVVILTFSWAGNRSAGLFMFLTLGISSCHIYILIVCLSYSRTRTRRAAEVSSSKECDTIEVTGKVCLQELAWSLTSSKLCSVNSSLSCFTPFRLWPMIPGLNDPWATSLLPKKPTGHNDPWANFVLYSGTC